MSDVESPAPLLFARLRRLLGDPGGVLVASPVRVAIQTTVLTFVLLAGTTGEVLHSPHVRPLDPFVYLLLLLAVAGRPLSALNRLAGYALTLGAALTYVASGYVPGPIYLAVFITLFLTVTADRPRRSIVLGLVTVAGFGLAQAVHVAFQDPSGALVAFAGTAAGSVGWTVAVLAVAHAFAYQRVRLVETQEAETRRRVTEERLRIARELHDVVSHSISVINVHAGVAAHVIDRRPEKARESLEVIRDTSKDVLRELRGILGVLRDEDDAAERRPAPGLSQLGELVEGSRRAGLPTTLSVTGEPRPLPPDVDLAAYRIVQESLTNALRHAGQATAAVHVAWEPGQLAVEVVDDGRGAAGIEPAPVGGHGLAGMRERAAAAGGSVEAGPRPVRGYRVRAVLPTGDAPPRASEPGRPAVRPLPPSRPASDRPG